MNNASATTAGILGHLGTLVACDTRNPPRDPAGVRGLMGYASVSLQASKFRVTQRDLGDGCLWLHAVRAASPAGPSSPASSSSVPLVNIHVDTVPADPAWTGEPLRLRTATVDGATRAIGLGACDIKGALAAYLVAASSTAGPAELLLTSDEEAGSSTCVNTFCREHAASLASRVLLVAEPTQCKAVLAHRGIGTATGTFKGTGGHASLERALVDSAVHEAVRWSARALAFAEEKRRAPDGGDIRLNIGVIEGGTKANMIAAQCKVRFGVRPHGDVAAAVDEVSALAPDATRVSWERGYTAPSLPSSQEGRARAQEAAERFGLPVGDAVDFFTEAALFAHAGAAAIVCGPGDIAQAHTAGEWVEVAQLEEMERIYRRILGGGAGGKA